MTDTTEIDLFDYDLALPPLTKEQEQELFTRRRNANQQEQQIIDDLIIRHNISFAAKEAASWSYRGPFRSLRRAAVRGLVYALQRYDERRGLKFISYAVWWIHNSMRHELSERRELVRPPSNIKQYVREYMRASEQTHGTADDILDEIECFGQDRTDVQAALDGHVSLDTPSIISNARRSLGDKLGAYEQQDDPDLWITYVDDAPVFVQSALDCLDAREKIVVTMYYGIGGALPQTLDQISKQFGCTRERVRQIKAQALVKLRKEFLKIGPDDLRNEIRRHKTIA